MADVHAHLDATIDALEKHLKKARVKLDAEKECGGINPYANNPRYFSI